MQTLLSFNEYLREVTRCVVVWCTQNLRHDGSSFMWHQPCQRCTYTTLVDNQKCAIKSYSCRITCECSESAQEWRTALYKSDQQQEEDCRHKIDAYTKNWQIFNRYGLTWPKFHLKLEKR